MINSNWLSVPDAPAQEFNADNDILFRFQQTSGNIRLSWIKTEDAMQFVKRRREVLVEALRGCKRQAQYWGYYTAYLLGQLSDEEFEDIANTFAVKETEADEVIAEKVAILVNETQTEFQTDQLAFMFSAPHSQIQRIEKRLAAQGKISLRR